MNTLHTSPDFAISFRVFQPQPAQPTALVVLLHGVGGSETNLADMAAAISAQAPNTLVVLPRGPLALGPGQFAWFRVAFTPQGPRIEAAEADSSRLALTRFVEQLQLAHGIAPQRTVVAGFSQGGIMSASLGLTAPERLAGFGILSGRILPELEPQLAEPARLAAVQAFVGHGELDSKLPVAWAERSDTWLTALGVRHQTRLYPIDHGISAAMQADFLVWLNSCIDSSLR
ncbi:phospholipase/carboxylesterase [Rhodoferax ferrireducens]|uniref:Phospholipase/carboxylesterase n=1 Tax=Rhodoferax ferrireducens TaxID=192843 RepID=A0ABU2C3M7_9BURK|nr:phospholipase [Rhodoferax ferrireducens]MDR7375935.1 phospholipase/carboxylesterase [Rhodoferax ferrireducens]